MRLLESRRLDDGSGVCIFAAAALLMAFCAEPLDRNSDGNALRAMRTMRSVDIISAAAKSAGDELAVDFGRQFKSGVHEGRAGIASGKVAAGICFGDEQR